MRREEEGHGVKKIFTGSASQVIRSSSEVQVRNYMFPSVNASFIKVSWSWLEETGVMVLLVETGELWWQNSHMTRQLILKKRHLIGARMLLMPFSLIISLCIIPLLFTCFPLNILIISLLLV